MGQEEGGETYHEGKERRVSGRAHFGGILREREIVPSEEKRKGKNAPPLGKGAQKRHAEEP